MFQRIIKLSVSIVRNYLPDPFVFAILLTVIAFICSMVVTGSSLISVLDSWGSGLWGLLGFAMQMALVIVCGSALAEATIVKSYLKRIASCISSPAMAIAIVTIVSSIACWINWGFGLIVGVVFAKEIAKVVKGVDYRLLIASSYSGFVVWHAGMSGSIPLSLATEGKMLEEVTVGYVKDAIPISQTILANYNILIIILVIIALTIVNTIMHPKEDNTFCIDPALLENEKVQSKDLDISTPADKLNNSIFLSVLIILSGITFLIYKLFIVGKSFDLNGAILVFMLMGLLFYKTPINYVRAISNSSKLCSGILLQFPFYAGIMGIMVASSQEGVSLAGEISKWCISVANERTFPLLSFISAGVVNFFVPSGGGQWAVQGPIMIPAGVNLGVSPAITGMAISWGDAWTNLIQPFWAIPALAIAKLDAKDIMGYCLIDLFVVGIIICTVFFFIS